MYILATLSPRERAARANQKTSPPSRAKTLLETELNSSMSEHQHGQDQISQQKTKDDEKPYNKKHGENQSLSKKQEAENNDKDQSPSKRNEGEDQIQRDIKKTSNTQRMSKKQYTEVCAFVGIDEVTLSNKRSCEETISIGLKSSCMRLVNCLFDTNAGRNLLCELIVDHDWICSIFICKKLWLQSATNQKDVVTVTITLCVRIADLGVRVMFGIVRKFAVPVFLGTSFIDKFVKWIFH